MMVMLSTNRCAVRDVQLHGSGGIAYLNLLIQIAGQRQVAAAGDIDRRNVLLGQSHCLNLSLVVASAQSPLADTLTVYGISKASYTFIRRRVPVRGCLAQDSIENQLARLPPSSYTSV